MRALLFWLTGFLPCRFIDDQGKRYLERYYLGKLFSLTFYVHRFVASDPDRGLHDHPWRKAWSLILSGWYFEERRIGVHPVKWFNRLTCESFHRVILPRDLMNQSKELWSAVPGLWDSEFHKFPKECWTLFFHTEGRPNRWGFLRTDPATIAPGSDPKAIFTPFRYGQENDAKKTENDQWWKTAQPGRKRGRVPL